MTVYTALLDANDLYPAAVRDILLHSRSRIYIMRNGAPTSTVNGSKRSCATNRIVIARCWSAPATEWINMSATTSSPAMNH